MLNLRRGFHDLSHPPPHNVAALDVLRSLAILLVFCGHYAGDFHAPAAVQKFPLAYFGWTGVDLFFVLSGYLIGAQIWKELQRSGGIQIGRFLLRRGLRIWPLYFSFVLLIGFEGLFLGRKASGLWADALCVSNYFHHQVSGGWSLSTEEQFYIVFPLATMAAIRFLTPKQMIVIPVAVLLALPLLRELTIQHYAGLPMAEIRERMYAPFHTHSDGLAVGVLIAWVQTFSKSLFNSARKVLLIAPVSMVVGAALYSFKREVFNFTSLALIFGGFVVLAIGIRFNAARWLANPFYLVSRLSYGIYLNHLGLLDRLMKPLGRWQGGGVAPFLITGALCFAVCTAFAGLTFLFIEHPFLQIRERWLKRTVSPDTAPAVGVYRQSA